MNIEKRSIVKGIILSIITFGIYGIYWVAKMAKQAVQVKDINDSATLEILLCIFFPFIGFYLAEKKLSEGCAQMGVQHSDNSVLYLVLGLFGLSIIDICLMQSSLNSLADMNIGNQPYTTVQ